MTRILFVERDRDIRDAAVEWGAALAPEIELVAVKSLEEAADHSKREFLNGVILDAIHPHIRDVVNFVKDTRQRDASVPILALIAYSDVILNVKLKEMLLKERVSYANKLQVLTPELFKPLVEACMARGFGEEISL